MKDDNHRLGALDFFAGSGLVTEGLLPFFHTVWANDICPKKGRVYTNNFRNEAFHLGPIENVSGANLPYAELAWASFPCQDLSLAGKMNGLKTGSRSALFWEWLRIIDEIPAHKSPSVLCLENVLGFLTIDEGRQFKLAYDALRARGYTGGAFVLDARHFTPQSRPRAFLVAVNKAISVDSLTSSAPLKAFHTTPVKTAYIAVNDSEWVWWKLPRPPLRVAMFSDICERDAPVDPPAKTARLLSMLSEANREKLSEALKQGTFTAGTAYKRIRKDKAGAKAQRLELRFDGLAGCLRVPSGGSSRQIVVIVESGAVRTRLLTVRELARLMGVRADYWLPESYTEAYWAMGDAVAVPVTRFLAGNLLQNLCQQLSADSLVSSSTPADHTGGA